MSSTNLNEEAGEECPLCMEPLEMDDLNFFPCTCGYQICRFCWHRIRTDENGLCPACRKAYPENPADFKPLSPEELQRIKQEKRAKDLQKKQKVTENRKHLSNVRVVQKNLVFVVGLSARLADAETLKKSEYFGKYGKIYKVVINHSTTYAGSQLQGPSASAYVTYQRAEDALRAIQAVNNIYIDGRTLKASLGTTKYCSHFMKNQQCPKVDCMYLHELGDEAASFTKEEMQQGKHQEFEKKLQDLYLGCGNPNGSTVGILTPEKPLCNSTSGSVTPGMSESPILTNPLTVASPLAINNKRSNGKENNAPKIGSQESLGPSSVVRDIWPSLNAAANKESKKSRSKGDRGNNSARHTPTEEQNNNHKRGSRERDMKECNGEDILEGEESSSPTTVTSTSSSGGDSCTSSTSNTPPPQCHPESAPPASSPLPVLGDGRRSPPSPIQTPSSSFSSCSEPSSSLPSCNSGGLLQQFPPAPPHPPSSGPPILQSPSNKMPTNSYIFPDNSNSFFSSGHRLSALHNHHESLVTSNPQLLHHNTELTNGHSDTLHSDWRTATTTTGLCSQNGSFSSNHTQPWEFDFDKIEEDISRNDIIDDDLGFDPFEETNKALAEDIKIEQKQQEQQRHQMQGNNHHHHHNSLSHHHHQHHNNIHSSHQQQTINTQQTEAQLLSLHSGLKSFLDNFPSSSNNSETRLPPPGFNGLAGLNPYGANQQHQQIGKMIPPSFYGGNLGSNPSLGSQNIARPMNGLVASSNRLNVPPGLSGNILAGTANSPMSNGLVSNLTGTLPTHLPPPSSILSVESTMGMAPPGLGHPKGDYLIKDLENGIRNMIPNGGSTSVSTMNTLNTVNTLNSLAAVAPSSSTSQNNPLASFLNMSQHHQPQQQQQQQQQQQVQHHQQQSIFSLPQFNSFSSQKGWPNSAAPDLTALDPAIVSSGQLTDSRSDSPPHWLKTMDLTGTDGLSHGQWNTMHPYNLVSVGHPSALGVQAAIPQRSSVWPPTSPPPGFSSISPLHHSKQHQPHKIENL